MALQEQVFSTGDYAWHSWSNGYVIALTLTEESVDAATNTSQISYLFTISNTDNNRFTSNDYSWTISIGGQSIPISHFSFNLATNYTTQVIASGRLTVEHNPDGTLAMPYAVSIPNVQNWTSYGPPVMSLSGTWALTTIQRTPPAISSVSIVDGNEKTFALTNNRNSVVRYYSDAVITATATAHNGAAITVLEASCGDGKKVSSAGNSLAGTLYGVESGSFTLKATDSLGNTTILPPVELPLVEYVKLTCSLSDNKPDTDGNMTVNVSGKYFNGSFGKVSNELTVQYRYKVSGGAWLDTEGEWQTMSVAVDGTGYHASASVSGLAYQTAYTFQARATDKLATVDSAEYTVRAMPVFDWSEKDFRFHVPVAGITADMVGARYASTNGAFLLKAAGVESGLLYARDGGNLSSYYLGLFHGYQSDRTNAIFHTLCANSLDIVTNVLGTVSALNAVGEVTYVIIPFTRI